MNRDENMKRELRAEAIFESIVVLIGFGIYLYLRSLVGATS